MTETETLWGTVVIEDRSITATFEHWQSILELFLDWSINDPERDQAKDAMSAMQTVIVACRASRKYQRDVIPMQRMIKVLFRGREWPVVKSAVLQYVEAAKARPG